MMEKVFAETKETQGPGPSSDSVTTLALIPFEHWRSGVKWSRSTGTNDRRRALQVEDAG